MLQGAIMSYWRYPGDESTKVPTHILSTSNLPNNYYPQRDHTTPNVMSTAHMYMF